MKNLINVKLTRNRKYEQAPNIYEWYYIFDRRGNPDGDESFIRAKNSISGYELIHIEKIGFGIYDEFKALSEDDAMSYLRKYQEDGGVAAPKKKTKKRV